jgi:hypothetical protein
MRCAPAVYAICRILLTRCQHSAWTRALTASTPLFVRYLDAKDARAKVVETTAFAVTRAVFMGGLGMIAAFIGGRFLGLHRWFWIALGLAYVALGAL